MKHFYKVGITFALMMIFSSSIFSQTNKFWSAHTKTEPIVKDKSVARLSFPSVFKLFDLNINEMRRELFKVVDNSQMHATVISIPNPDGQLEEFEVVEASNFEPALQSQFPEIRAFSGKGITDKYASLKLSISPQGIQTMVFRADKPNEFIEAYSQDHTVYAVFNPQRKPGGLPWKCYSPDEVLANGLNNQVNNNHITARNTGDLKTMRLAQSVTAEYSNYFGATSSAQVGLVLAAVNATLTRCNGCYEKDLSIHLNLIANTTSVFYYNAATDPYSAAAQMNNWNSQLQTTLTSVIGEANYDIGHLFGKSGGGGNAGCIGCVCTNNQKGSGITSPADGIPQGDNFDIDYVVHEVGHQLGGTHTFSDNNEGSGTNVEVGGGITIMGYAGITSYDPAPHSIDIYHATSISQIQTNLNTKTCPITTSLAGNNATPVLSPVSNYTIPKGTPFALTGSATDADGDALTYCWEQMDDGAGQTGANSIAKTTKTSGPNWISFSPTSSPTRLFPKLTTILAGKDTTGTIGGDDPTVRVEALSSVARTLNFRVTVRDNCPYSSTAPIKVGQTQFTNTAVTVSGTTGPFLITSANTATTWAGGTSQTVTWSVNGTTGAPINCANVNILLSYDGGYTWPVTLASNTANDGTEAITVPNQPSTTVRIKVESIGNIFFDINNANITITPSANGFALNNVAATTINCGANSATASMATSAVGTFSGAITLSATGNPTGTTVTFGTNPVTTGNSTNITLNNTASLAPGTYNVTINGSSPSASNQSTTVSFVVPGITTQPTGGTICSGSNYTFSSATVGNGAIYQWQVSTNNGSSYSNISGATSSSYTLTNVPASANGNMYQVVVTGICSSPVTSNADTLFVNQLPTVSAASNLPAVCTGTSVTLTASGANTYSWTPGNQTGSTITVTPVVSPSAPGNPLVNSYTVTGTTTAGCQNTATVNVTANPLPTVTLSVSPYTTLYPGLTTTLTANVTPSSANTTYQWYLNGNAISGATGQTLSVNVDGLGVYTASASINGNCTNTSTRSITISDSANTSLFIMPNPNNGIFQVRFNDKLNGVTPVRTITVYDATGKRVYKQTFTVNRPFEKMDINLTKLSSGIYFVDLTDASGNRLKSGKVVIKP